MSENIPDPQELDDLDEPEEYDSFDPDDLDLEAPTADAAEQRQELLERASRGGAGTGPFEADPSDAAEQQRVVEIDEDDYR